MSDDEQLAELRALLKAAPVPPDEPDPAGATNEQLLLLRRLLGFDVPGQLARWLKTCNGSLAGPGGLYGTHTVREWLDIASIYSLYPGWRTLQWIPVAGDGCGNHYVIDASRANVDSDAVYFIDTMASPGDFAYVVGSDLFRFLWFLLCREVRNDRRWPFDRSFVLNKDPELEAIREPDLLPWAAP